jgi:hypothetical protein
VRPRQGSQGRKEKRMIPRSEAGLEEEEALA